MNNQHPITPPLALIDQWWDEAKQNAKYDEPIGPLVAIQAARWGADQELEACAEWLDQSTVGMADLLRAARRPKPPSLKEQALNVIKRKRPNQVFSGEEQDTIRRALEALDD